jgi:hypothetical protein
MKKRKKFSVSFLTFLRGELEDRNEYMGRGRKVMRDVVQSDIDMVSRKIIYDSVPIEILFFTLHHCLQIR